MTGRLCLPNPDYLPPSGLSMSVSTEQTKPLGPCACVKIGGEIVCFAFPQYLGSPRSNH